MEIELKLLVNSQDVAVLCQHPLLKKYATADSHELKMSDTYFDTPDLQIRRSDAGLRVRRVNGNWVQTLNGGGDAMGGLHSRHEWESEVAGPVPEVAELQDRVHKSAWTKMLRSPKFGEALLPIFKTRIKRRVWALRLPHGDEVECVLDLGTIECDNQKVPISEIELELKSGDPTHLFDFALALLEDIPLRIGNLSKADRGYALYSPQSPAAVGATLVPLLKRMTIEQAFQAIAGNCMMQIQANAACVAQADDMESLHQMRVGLRRLHAALGLFKDMLRPPEDLLMEFDWLAIQLGAARDWDVLASTTLPAVAAAMPDETRFAEVTQAAMDKAHETHKAAAHAVRSLRFTRLILLFSRWLLSCGWHDAMPRQGRVRLMGRVTKFTRNVLKYEQSRLLKRGRKLQGASAKGRHRVRIAAKNARYATEFFLSLYSSQNIQPYVDALTILQKELGRLNDATVAGRLLKEFQDGQDHLEGSAGFIRGYLGSHADNDDKKIRKIWKKFAAIKLRC
jgi:triphosphatase